MTLDQLRAFLTELQKNKELLNAIRVAATANEIAEIASGFGYQFSGDTGVEHSIHRCNYNKKYY